MYIDWDLNIRLCCHDWKEKKVMGSLINNSISNVWNNDVYGGYRTHLLKGARYKLNPCSKCNAHGLRDVYA